MMKKIAKNIVKRLTESVPLSAYQLLIRREVIGLCYHVVSDKPLYHIRHLHCYKSTEMFESDLAFLRQNWNLISYGQLLEHYFSKTKIKPNSVIITFDDGYSECFSIARPLLLKYKIPCIFFVITDSIDNKKVFYRNKVSLCIERIKTTGNLRKNAFFHKTNRAFGQSIRNLESFVQWIKSLGSSDEEIINGICSMLDINTDQYVASNKLYLTSEEIKILVSDGFTIGAHTKKHPRLDLLKCESNVEKEIIDSCERIRDLTGRDHIPFAFPYSGDGIDRCFLERLISKHKFIPILFDAKNLKSDRDFIINRIVADQPSFSPSARSNIPQILRTAYKNHLIYTHPRVERIALQFGSWIES
jgi:peptidoglycan/xylan/chitin deacetylase (PgdA/CDA1 family)